MAKSSEKEQAIALRKQGKTYNEILEVVPVAKSTLSLWLRDVGLATAQQQRVTAKKRSAQLRGGARRREMRLAETKDIYQQCAQDITKVTNQELFLIGVALYWAEGAKKNADKPGTMVDFANTDPAMVRLFLRWLYQFGGVTESDIVLRLHIHENHKYREKDIKQYWAQQLDVPVSVFGTTLGLVAPNKVHPHQHSRPSGRECLVMV